jgi:hypothetical protein
MKPSASARTTESRSVAPCNFVYTENALERILDAFPGASEGAVRVGELEARPSPRDRLSTLRKMPPIP